VYVIQERLARVAAAYGMQSARITAFPTSLLVSLGGGEATALELTTPVTAVRLDQIAVLHRLANDAEHASLQPATGLARLDEARELEPFWAVGEHRRVQRLHHRHRAHPASSAA
jgi:uncharacterized membrane protein YjjP (DUF1212 family)